VSLLGKIIRNSLVIVCSVLIAVAVIFGVWIFQDVNPNSSQLQGSSLIPILAEPPLSPPANAVIVPDDYPTIQQAVTYASNGSMVFVRTGTYNETVTIDKPLWLAGENKESTVIDAHSIGPDVLICSNSVNVTGFCMLNTPTPAKGNWLVPGYEYPTQRPNIQICNASHCNIYGNSLTNSSSGVRIENSSQNNVIGNAISENINGVKLASSADNCVARNEISGGDSGIVLDSSINNTVIDNIITGILLVRFISILHLKTL